MIMEVIDNYITKNDTICILFQFVLPLYVVVTKIWKLGRVYKDANLENLVSEGIMKYDETIKIMMMVKFTVE